MSIRKIIVARFRGKVNEVRTSQETAMSKEKFDRSKPHVNIGHRMHIDHGKTTLSCGDHEVLAKPDPKNIPDFDSSQPAP